MYILNTNENIFQPLWKLASNDALTFEEAHLYIFHYALYISLVFSLITFIL